MREKNQGKKNCKNKSLKRYKKMEKSRNKDKIKK